MSYMEYSAMMGGGFLGGSTGSTSGPDAHISQDAFERKVKQLKESGQPVTFDRILGDAVNGRA